MTDLLYIEEAAYARAMEAIASGCTRQETRHFLAVSDPYRDLTTHQRAEIMRDALDGALSCGIGYDDIDPSWFHRSSV